MLGAKVCNRVLIEEERYLTRNFLAGENNGWHKNYWVTFDLKMSGETMTNYGSVVHVKFPSMLGYRMPEILVKPSSPPRVVVLSETIFLLWLFI